MEARRFRRAGHKAARFVTVVVPRAWHDSICRSEGAVSRPAGRNRRGRSQRPLENSSFILGREVAAFEEQFAAYCETAQAIGVNSGTSALHLALLAAGDRAGRRSHHRSVHLRGHRGGDRLHRRHARCWSISTRSPIRWTRPASRRRSPRAPGRSCRYTSSGSRPIWTRSWRSPDATV